MNIAHRIATAFANMLIGQNLPGDPTIVSALSSDLNEETQSRLIIVGDSADLYKTNLPGLYSIKGRINVIESLDADDGEARFNAICRAMEDFMGLKSEIPELVSMQDPTLHLYTYNFIGSMPGIATRRLMASYQWDALARQTPNSN